MGFERSALGTRLPVAAGVGFLLLGQWVAGCQNQCQSLCTRLADYAEECNLSVPEAELDACIDAQADADRDDKKLCDDYGTAERIRQEWDCAELEAYWGADAGGAAE